METSWYETDIQSPHRELLPGEEYIPTSEPLVHAYTLAVEAKEK